MKVIKISITNLQSYFEENEFKFKDGVNLILADNGGGKSSLFNAFYWVLFDRVYETDKGWVEFHDGFINERSKKSLKLNEQNKLSVSLIINAKEYNAKSVTENVEYTFKRDIAFKNINGKVNIFGSSDFLISYVNNYGETKIIDHADTKRCIESIIPRAIRDYIWFQGETISELIDFNNSVTLNDAINKISYFPHYKTLNKIIDGIIPNLSNEINKHIKNGSRQSNKLNDAISTITTEQQNVKIEKQKLDPLKEEIEELKNNISNRKLALEGISDNQDLSESMDKLSNEQMSLQKSLDENNSEERKLIIEKWMLKGINPFIKESKIKLESFIDEIREKSKNSNPIPIQIPGSIYIKKMLEDEKCHICERDAEKGSDAYRAIENRKRTAEDLQREFEEKGKDYREKENNFISLINRPDAVLMEINKIDDEIKHHYEKFDSIITRLLAIKNEKDDILKKAGIRDEDQLKNSGARLQSLLRDIENYGRQIRQKESLQQSIRNNILRKEAIIDQNEKIRDKNSNISDKIPEQIAKPYFNLLAKICDKLEENAKEKLISEIEDTSSELLHGYLETSLAFKGYIKIDRNRYKVELVDRKDNSVGVINKGNLTAAKMSVINSILHLSSKKMNKVYPMISDAPSSVLDEQNTMSYMNKLGATFEQAIIMTKDLYNMDVSQLRAIDKISRVYKLTNQKIDSEITKEDIGNHRTIIGKPII